MVAPLYPNSHAQNDPIFYEPFNNPPLNVGPAIIPAAIPAPAQVVAQPAHQDQVRAHYKCASIAWNILKNAFTCTGVTVIVASVVCLLSFISGHVPVGMSITITMPLIAVGAFGVSITLLTVYALYRAIMHRPAIVAPRMLTEIECIEIELKNICKSCEIAVQYNRLDLALNYLKTLKTLMQPESPNPILPSIPTLIECLPTLYQLLDLPRHREVQAVYSHEYQEHFTHECRALINWIQVLQEAVR